MMLKQAIQSKIYHDCCGHCESQGTLSRT